MLHELEITPTDRPLTETAVAFIQAGRSRFKTVNCFDFVPCDYELAWRMLDALPRGTLCEWGSGFGILTGLAELLGFSASGIELDENLANASRQLLSDFQLSADIECSDYFQSETRADYYFVYCWPSRMNQTEGRFENIATIDTKLLICHGQSDIRCKRLTKRSQ